MDTPGCSIPIEDRQNTGAARKYKASVRPWDIRSADESSRLQPPSEGREQFLFQLQVRRHQVQEGNSAVAAYDATFNSGVVKRISLAGFPATMALSGTS
jgi:hypothetical protein